MCRAHITVVLPTFHNICCSSSMAADGLFLPCQMPIPGAALSFLITTHIALFTATKVRNFHAFNKIATHDELYLILW